MNDSLPPLPEYEPRPDSWARIEADLMRLTVQSAKRVDRALPALPTYEPKPQLWEAIQNELDAVPVRPIWQAAYPQWIRAGLTVAAMLIGVGSWLWLDPGATERVRVEYTVEPTTSPLPTQQAGSPPLSTKGVEAFIARHCAQQRLACQRPEVHELRNELVELTTQQQRLARQQQVFGDDPVFLRAQQQLDHQRAQVLKELIMILRS